MSGVCYGLYTGFLTLAQTQGVWGEWLTGEVWGPGNPALSTFTVTFALAALAAAINDSFSGIWSLAVCAKNRQLGDLAKTITSKPGLVMMLCAAIGGPVATIAYVIALNSATASGNPGVIVPIAALNCAIGTILGRILFKQKLKWHMAAGVGVCLIAAALIGGASFASVGPDALLGCLFALLAAFGWGFEGCVAGFGTTLIDYRIGIAIRQITAGALELLVAFPILATMGNGIDEIAILAKAAFTDPSLAIFAVSGLFAMPAFSFWYKGNSMCGAALGMACNGMYAFWGPLFIWLIMGVLNIGGLAADYPPLTPIQWIGAIIMMAGIFLIATNPSVLLHKRKLHKTTGQLAPLNYAIIKLFMDGKSRCAQDVVIELEQDYGGYRLLTTKNIDEVLATARENGLLDEAGVSLSSNGDLHIFFQLNEYGKRMVERYIER